MSDRRHFIATAAAAGLAATLPRFAAASTALGSARLDVLSDGDMTLPAEFLFGDMPREELARIMADAGSPLGETASQDCNVTLLRDGDRTILFDTGAGPAFLNSTGRLFESLDFAGLSVDDITHVVFTHGHPDHLWGVIDDFDEPAFPNAQLMMGRIDFDYWRDPATVGTIGDARASTAAGAARRLDLTAERFSFFEAGDEVLPGIEAVASYGHTPGHMAFSLHHGGEPVMVLGDAITNAHVALARPDWHAGNDQDAATAAATRVALLDRITADGGHVVGYHMPHPGLGRIEANPAGGHRYIAD